MSESSLDRTSRALDLIPFVTNNPGFSLAELADRFNSTPTQIFKDLEMLFMCGLPGYSHLELIDMELSEDYVAINNPQNLDLPRRFSFQEIASLTLGLQALLPLTRNPELADRISILITRLVAMVAEGERAQLELFSVQSETLKGMWDEVISTAALRQSAISIDYLSARTDSLTTRTIFPEFTYSSRGYLYTKALCTLSGEMRHFRHDRIMRAQELPDAIRPEEVRNLHEKAVTIRAILSRRNLYFVEAHPTIVASSTIEDDQIEVTFELGDSEWLLRELSTLPGRVEILHPATFWEAYHARLGAILSLYR